MIAVENLNVSYDSIQVIGSNSDTLKFEFNGITYIKFRAKDLIKEIRSCGKDKINMVIVGKANVNSWGGRTTPQILLEEIEIKDSSIYDF